MIFDQPQVSKHGDENSHRATDKKASRFFHHMNQDYGLVFVFTETKEELKNFPVDKFVEEVLFIGRKVSMPSLYQRILEKTNTIPVNAIGKNIRYVKISKDLNFYKKTLILDPQITRVEVICGEFYSISHLLLLD